MRALVIAGIIVLLGIIGFLLLRRFEHGEIYQPSPDLEGTPREFGLDYRNLFFHSEKERLQGWFVPAEEARGTLLYCHGNSGNISHCLDTVQLYHEMGMSVFVYDYRGYGNSTGEPSEAGLYADAQAAWETLTGSLGISPERIVIFGRSLGGAVAVDLASRRQAAGLIVEASFPSMKELAQVLHPMLPVDLILSNHYRSADKLARVTCPSLFIHSREDELVPWDLGQRLFSAAREPRSFLEITGTHGEGFLNSGEAYRLPVSRFLTETLGPEPDA